MRDDATLTGAASRAMMGLQAYNLACKRAYPPMRTSRRTLRTEEDLDQADRDLARRQWEHLERVATRRPKYHPSQCAHNQCSQCHGTGVDSSGRKCIHFISCPCPKCTPYCY